LSDFQGGLKGVIERHYQYDRSGQLVQWMDQHRGLTRYGYDAAGRITRSQFGLMKDWRRVGVRADAAGNVTSHPMAANEQFQWDAASNPLPADAASSPGSDGNFVPGNRLLVWQDARYAYDEHGNLIERLKGKRGSAGQTRTHFTWDAAHQLVRAEVARGPDDTATTQAFSYAYDALGRRITKTDAFGTTHFAWDGDRMALEQRGGNETTHLYHPESFVPLAQIHNGSLHQASNDAGEITWRVTYRTWGNLVTEEVTEIQQRLRFQGQYFDAETGLHYNRFRYYSPEVMGFISQDPIGLWGGGNFYSYAPNSTNWIDPNGLSEVKPCGCGGGDVNPVTGKPKGALQKLAKMIREAGKHKPAINQRVIAVGQNAAGVLFAGSSNGFDAGQRAMADKLGIQRVPSSTGNHAEENLVKCVPDLKSVGTSKREPCGPTEHNCAGKLAELKIDVDNVPGGG
jgi:RHS repeat-associated protein